MPLYALLQMERISAGIFIKGPVLCQGRNHLILSVMRSQSIENQDIDLSMLIHSRVNAGIISAAVNQRSAILPGFRTGLISGFLLSCSTVLLLAALYSCFVCFRRTAGRQNGHRAARQ